MCANYFAPCEEVFVLHEIFIWCAEFEKVEKRDPRKCAS